MNKSIVLPVINLASEIKDENFVVVKIPDGTLMSANNDFIILCLTDSQLESMLLDVGVKLQPPKPESVQERMERILNNLPLPSEKTVEHTRQVESTAVRKWQKGPDGVNRIVEEVGKAPPMPITRNDPNSVDGTYNRMKRLASSDKPNVFELAGVPLYILMQGLKEGLFRRRSLRIQIADIASRKGVVDGESPNFKSIPSVWSDFCASYREDLDPPDQLPSYGGASASTQSPTEPSNAELSKAMRQELESRGLEVFGDPAEPRTYLPEGHEGWTPPALAPKTITAEDIAYRNPQFSLQKE